MSKRNISLLVSLLLLLIYSGKNYSNTKQPPAVITPTPTSEPLIVTASASGILTTVLKVVDGDTIKIASGQTVRYIGIDTPETVDPRRPVQCFGNEASDRNKQLVEGKVVNLEKDISETDKYGRLLRYVWIGETLINEQLVREGFAHSSSYPPDIKYQERFKLAEKLARQEKLGLWGDACIN